MLGLLAATFTIRSAAWTYSIKTLGYIEATKREQILTELQWIINSQYNETIAGWFCNYWNYVNEE